jgi:uncharacterized protein (DUF58 family)
MQVTIKKFFSRLFTAKRPFKLTRPGWVFILYSIGVGAGAINTGNNLLYIVFGIFLGLLLASGVLSDLSLWGLDVAWIFPSTLRANERADVWITVTNTKRWWSSLGVSIVLEGTLGGSPVRFSAYAPCVRKHESLRLPAGWTPDRRGAFRLEQIRVSTRYPFGLLEKWWRVYRGAPEFSALVQPPRVAISTRAMWQAAMGDERASSRHAQHEGASSSTVREYHAGDNPRRIHWRASAKRGSSASSRAQSSWLVRQMEPEEQHRVLLELPLPAEVTRYSEASIEKLVAFAASLRNQLLERGWSVELVLNNRTVPDAHTLFALWNPRQSWNGNAATPIEHESRRARMPVLPLFDNADRGSAA